MRNVVVTRVPYSGPPRRSRRLEERRTARFPSLSRRVATCSAATTASRCCKRLLLKPLDAESPADIRVVPKKRRRETCRRLALRRGENASPRTRIGGEAGEARFWPALPITLPLAPDQPLSLLVGLKMRRP
jgi:hypothetical protein